ncbi:RNA-binding domain-containing protein [Cystobasidium minutum MCA 4210]|uniref:RNA-binding domain-containing protein n=1 Tax=Cystobasidium minutum MCA 4210 TaxID=1397322 RepID=UPI0034CE5A4F|eukprot:jgi/Rhomi1/53376/CE53375_5217
MADQEYDSAPASPPPATANENGNGSNIEEAERSPVDTRRGEDSMMDRERSPAYGRSQDDNRDDGRDARDSRDDGRDARGSTRERSPTRRPPPPPPGRDREAQRSNVLGCFGLSIRTRDIDLEDEFNRYGHVEKAVIVYDQRSERSRGFGFVTMRDEEEAERCIEKLNGIELHGRNIRVAYSLTTKPHASTPGEYMGFKTDRDPRGPPPRRYDDRPRGGGYDRYDDRRAPRGYDDRRGGYDDRDRGGYRGGRDRDYDDRRGGYSSYSSRGRDYDDRDREPPRRDDRYASTQAAPMAAPAAYEDRYASRGDDRRPPRDDR